MKSRHRISLFTLLSALVLWCCGCATGGSVAGKKPLDPEAVKNGGVIIAGVSIDVLDQDLKQSLERARLLEEEFRRRQPGMVVQGATAVYKALGASLYSQMLNSVQFHGVAGGVYMDLIRSSVSGPRYLVFARIQDDRTLQTVQAQDTKSVQLQSTRVLTVSLLIYDLQHARRDNLVWAGALQEAATQQKLVFVQAGGDIPAQLYPPAPAVGTVLAKVFPRLLQYLFTTDN